MRRDITVWYLLKSITILRRYIQYAIHRTKAVFTLAVRTITSFCWIS